MQERRTIYCRADHLCVDKRGSGTQVKGLVLQTWKVSTETGGKEEGVDPEASRQVAVVGSYEVEGERADRPLTA